ncbi:MAG: hypothetical protein Q7U40_01360, partial [Desulfatirhabdiaceae bacterium]|nr:hypothetical protein [Desulfatirhabdiaceae bacterium]
MRTESINDKTRTSPAVMMRIKDISPALLIPGRIFGMMAIGMLLASVAWAADPQPAGNFPMISIAMDKAKGPEDVSVVIQIFAALTLLSIAP